MILEEELNWKDFKTKADATFVTSQKSRNPPLLFNGKEYFKKLTFYAYVFGLVARMIKSLQYVVPRR